MTPNIPNVNEIPEEGYLSEEGLRHFADGSIIVEPKDDEGLPKPVLEFHEQNVAEFLDDSVLSSIGHSLRMAIEEDKESQQEFYQNLSNLIKQLGFSPDKLSAGGADGEIGVTSPAVFETWLHFIATIMGSIWPSNNPVDCVIIGEPTEKLENQAYRVSRFCSNYLQNIDKGFDKELQRTIAWSIFDTVYSKVFIDPVMGRPTHRMIKPEDFIINRDLSSHLSATRKTQVHHMDEREFELRKLIGEYRDIDILTTNSDGGDDNVIEETLDQISGYQRSNNQNSYNSSKYEIWECHCEYKIKEDPKAGKIDIALPYIITLDAKSGTILRISRNWDKDDFLKKHKEYFVSWGLFPSLDGESYGMAQTASNAAQCATLMTQQLAQSALYANFPAGLYSQGLRLENNSLRPRSGEWLPIQTGGNPISESIMPLPYKDPSPILMDIKNGIEDSIRKPSAIVNDAITEMAPRAPAASVLAMLENMQRVPNFVLQGYHKSFQLMLELFKNRFADWLPENKPYPFKVPGGNHEIMKNDFCDSIQIVPASDPSLQNAMYRLMRAEIILNNARQNPELHDLRVANEMFYKSLNISVEDINKLLLPAPPKDDDAPPPYLNPISENQNLILGKPIKAYIDQDHDAHLIVHKSLLDNPDAQDPNVIAANQAHQAEHVAFKLLVQFQAQTNQPLPENIEELPPEIQNQIATMAAQLAQQQQAEAQESAPPDPALMQAQATLIQAQAVADEVKVNELEINLKSETDKIKLNLDQARLEYDKEKTMQDFDYKERELQFNRERVMNEFHNKQLELELKMQEVAGKLNIEQQKAGIETQVPEQEEVNNELSTMENAPEQDNYVDNTDENMINYNGGEQNDSVELNNVPDQ